MCLLGVFFLVYLDLLLPGLEGLEGVTCSKSGLKLSSTKNLEFMTQFRYLGHSSLDIAV